MLFVTVMSCLLTALDKKAPLKSMCFRQLSSRVELWSIAGKVCISYLTLVVNVSPLAAIMLYVELALTFYFCM